MHELVDEFAFQQMIPHLPQAPVMLELGACWAHYSMWLNLARPAATTVMVEPDAADLAAGQANFARAGYQGIFLQALVGPQGFGVDACLAQAGVADLTILHAGIQGAGVDMLHGAALALADRRVGYVFVSTHSQALHGAVCGILQGHGYRVELSSDHDHESTSADDFVLAVSPDLPPVYQGPAPMGRSQIAGATPEAVLHHLTQVAAAAHRTAPGPPSVALTPPARCTICRPG